MSSTSVFSPVQSRSKKNNSTMESHSLVNYIHFCVRNALLGNNNVAKHWKQRNFSDRSCWELIITTTSHGTSRFVSEHKHKPDTNLLVP